MVDEPMNDTDGGRAAEPLELDFEAFGAAGQAHGQAQEPARREAREPAHIRAKAGRPGGLDVDVRDHSLGQVHVPVLGRDLQVAADRDGSSASAGGGRTSLRDGSGAPAFWPTVTAFGALWGTLEITLGAFLHTVRVPFGGALLAACGAGLLVAQRQVLRRPGAAIATGVVAALCKSISPGGVILGPMIGILAESFLVEIALLGGRGIAPAALAGIACTGWAAFQKIFGQYVFYGGTVLKLYLAMLRRAGDWLGIPPEVGWPAFAALMAVLGLIGVGIGVLGRQAGRAALSRIAGGDGPEEWAASESALAGVARSGPRRKAALRLPAVGETTGGFAGVFGRFMPLLAVVVIALQFPGRLAPSFFALVAWIAALAIADRRALDRLRMPRFWTFSIGIALLSGLFLGEADLHVGPIGLSRRGLEAGALMIMRGALVFGLASWASRAARGWKLGRLAGRLGLSPLAEAVSVAFDLLPDLSDRVRATASERGIGRSGTGRAARLFDGAVDLLAEAVRLAGTVGDRGGVGTGPGRSTPPGVNVAAVVGPPGSGKTTVLEDVAGRLASHGLRIGGVIQPSAPSTACREGYRLRDPGTGDERPFVVRQAGADGGAGRCVFDPDGWTWAAHRIRAARSSADAVLVDELGRLEAHGRGHVPALTASAEGREAPWWIVAVREDREEAISRRLGPFALVERIGTGADPARLEEAARRIAARVADASGRLGTRED